MITVGARQSGKTTKAIEEFKSCENSVLVTHSVQRAEQIRHDFEFTAGEATRIISFGTFMNSPLSRNNSGTWIIFDELGLCLELFYRGGISAYLTPEAVMNTGRHLERNEEINWRNLICEH